MIPLLCPFCGGEPKMSKEDELVGKDAYASRQTVFRIICGQCFGQTGASIKEDIAWTKWNSRNSKR